MDKFHEVREMIELWNENIQREFRSGYINCLDESISIWHNRYTCPGSVWCPRKPHPFGNEYHTICCGLTGIMFGIDLVEGKDRPVELSANDDPNGRGKTVELLARMCAPLTQTGKIVTLDSGFCVLSAIILLATMGIYAAAQIKKRRYWPAGVPGEEIKRKMKDEPDGTLNCVRGEINEVKYSIFAAKEPTYTSMMMSTYGSIQPTDYKASRYKVFDGTTIDFFLNDVFANHFKYRHIVDDHNLLRHMIPSIEDTWKTSHWPNRQFAFVLAISEVNTFKGFHYFIWKGMSRMDSYLFRKELALEMIHNEYLPIDYDSEEDESRKRVRRSQRGRLIQKSDHQFQCAPRFGKNITRGNWEFDRSKPYHHHTCNTPGCTARVRTYCSCSVGTWMCPQCFGEHCYDVAIEFSSSV